MCNCGATGADFSLRDFGFGEALPSHVATYRTDMGLPHRDYSVSVGSDADTETDGIMSPEHAVRLWGRSNTKSGRSSCLSSRANSNLTLTDTEHENTENGRRTFPSKTSNHLFFLSICFIRLHKSEVTVLSLINSLWILFEGSKTFRLKQYIKIKLVGICLVSDVFNWELNLQRIRYFCFDLAFFI